MIVYTCTYISLITMTNKSVMTFISVNKISVCLSVCQPFFHETVGKIITSYTYTLFYIYKKKFCYKYF